MLCWAPQLANIAAARVEPFRVTHVSLTPPALISRLPDTIMHVKCEQIKYLLSVWTRGYDISSFSFTSMLSRRVFDLVC